MAPRPRQKRRPRNRRLQPFRRTLRPTIRKRPIRRRRQRMKQLHPYTECRLQPFSGKNTNFAGIPDYNNSRRIVIDHVGITDFNVTSGSLVVRCLPTLPFGALFQPSTGTVYTMNDVATGTAVGATWGSTASNAWMPACAYSAYNTQISAGGYASTVGPYNQTKCRMVGAAWRIIYTGAPLYAQGLMQIRDFPVTVDLIDILPANALTIPNNANSGNSVQATATQTMSLDFAASSGSSTEMTQTAMMRLDHNPWGLLKHVMPEYLFQPYYEEPCFPISSLTTAAQVVAAATTPIVGLVCYSGAGSWGGTINCFDDAFAASEIRLSTIGSNAMSFRLEVRSCWEYIVQPNSAVYGLTKSAPPPAMDVVRKTEAVISKLPPAMPASASINLNTDDNVIGLDSYP